MTYSIAHASSHETSQRPQLLKLLQGEAGREISDSELVSTVRAYQSRFSLDDVKC